MSVRQRFLRLGDGLGDPDILGTATGVDGPVGAGGNLRTPVADLLVTAAGEAESDGEPQWSSDPNAGIGCSCDFHVRFP